jgi:hypothetical protein
MKKSLILLAIGLMIAPMAWSQSNAVLSLRAVDDAVNGGTLYVDDDNFQLAGAPAGAVFCVEVVLTGLDYTLAGYEFQINYPSYLTLLNPNDYEDQGGLQADWPYTVAYDPGTYPFQQLSANADGENTGDSDENTSGYTRKGLVFTNTGMRPTSGDHVLAKLRFVLGTGYTTAGAAQTSPNCISSVEAIELFACASGAGCPIFADQDAASVSHNFVSADLRVNLNNSDANWIKGDTNLDGTRDFFDALDGIRCLALGIGTADCTLMGHPDVIQILDGNCDEAANFFDILPHIKRVTGNINRHAGSAKKVDVQSLAQRGVLHVDSDAKVGAASMTEFVVNGAKFGDIQLDKADQDNGWMAYGDHNEGQGVYRVYLFRTKPGDAPFPSVDVPYETKGDASLFLNYTQATTSNNKVIGMRHNVKSIEIR